MEEGDLQPQDDDESTSLGPLHDALASPLPLSNEGEFGTGRCIIIACWVFTLDTGVSSSNIANLKNRHQLRTTNNERNDSRNSTARFLLSLP